MANIIISYNRQNEDITRILADDIKALGHTVWFDQELSGGQAWWDHILERVRNCDVFVFVLNPESLNSTACKREYSYASNLGKPILPILVAEGVSINLLPPALSQIQFVDYRKQDRNAALHLARALTTVPPAKGLPDPLPPQPEAPISYLGSLTKQIETTSTLSYEEQSALVVDLKRSFRDPEAADDARTLLEKLRKRRDLFATIAEEIDELLTSTRKASSVESKSQVNQNVKEALPKTPIEAGREPLGSKISKPPTAQPAPTEPLVNERKGAQKVEEQLLPKVSETTISKQEPADAIQTQRKGTPKEEMLESDIKKDLWLDRTKTIVQKGMNAKTRGKLVKVFVAILIFAVIIIFVGFLARSIGPQQEIAERTLNGDVVDTKDEEGLTDVRLVSHQGRKELEELLIANGADVDTKNEEGLTALHLAARQGSKDAVELLLDNGANINVIQTGWPSWMPLHEAAVANHKEVAELLIERGADVNSNCARAGNGRFGGTPLHEAVFEGHRDMTELLVSKGADINAKQSGGLTPLDIAAFVGHKDTVELLIARGADVNIRDRGGRTALRWARHGRHKEIVELLQKHRAVE